MPVQVHKRNPGDAPVVSVILLDWSVREKFHALDWLSRQDVPRDQYELVWVELFDRVVPEVMQKADAVITCGWEGLYHKHKGLNVGYLQAKGKIVTVCDSDAVFPPDYIGSIIKAFYLNGAEEPRPIVLMHYQARTSEVYPAGLSEIAQLKQYPWEGLWPNVGASVSMRRIDALRFGGWDEHKSFRGYCAGADLAWRLVNAGLEEIWHDGSVCLYHFRHPWGWKEAVNPHVDLLNMTAVEAFSSGRLLPLVENPEIHQLRMSSRKIGSSFEEQYAWMKPRSRLHKLGMRTRLLVTAHITNRLKFHLKRIPGVHRIYWALRRASGSRLGKLKVRS